MYNEMLFFTQILFIASVTVAALRRGSEALVAWICMQTLLSDLFVTKQMVLFGLQVTCSDAYAVGTILGINLLQEFYGRHKARQAIWTSFYLSLSYIMLSQVHVAFLPSQQDWAHGHVRALLSPMPRILVASLATYLFVELVDSRFFALLRTALGGALLPLRTAISLLVSQALDTVMFSILGLWGLVASLHEIMFFSFAIKVAIVLCIAPITSFISLVLTQRRQQEEEHEVV